MSVIELGDLVRCTGGMHRGTQGLYIDRKVYGGKTGYVSVLVNGKGKKASRTLRINEDQLEKVEA